MCLVERSGFGLNALLGRTAALRNDQVFECRESATHGEHDRLEFHARRWRILLQHLFERILLLCKIDKAGDLFVDGARLKIVGESVADAVQAFRSIPEPWLKCAVRGHSLNQADHLMALKASPPSSVESFWES